MSDQFRVRGLDPLGRAAEAVIIAASVADARSQAEEAGLRCILVERVRPDAEPAELTEREVGEPRIGPWERR